MRSNGKKWRKINSFSKPLEISTMIHKENEEIYNQLFNLEVKYKELGDKSITCLQLVKHKKWYRNWVETKYAKDVNDESKSIKYSENQKT